MNKQQKYFITISGPNGAGKSTFYKYVLSNNPFLSDAVFLNYDNEFAKLRSMPEYAAQYKQIATNMENQINIASTNAAATFKKQMEQIGGNLNERINQPSENKDYWHEQYLIFTHIPLGWEHIKENLNTRADLAKKLGGRTIHDRINTKAENNNWYVNYKKLINNLEIQKTIITNTANYQTKLLDRQLSVLAVKNIRNKMSAATSNGKNIIYETVGFGKKLQAIAKQNNYNICAIHICVLHQEISIARVQQRVQKGGHDVLPGFIVRRYKEYLDLLADALSSEQSAIVVDNSGKKPYIPIFVLSDGRLANITQCPEYLQETHKQISDNMPEKPIKELLHLHKDIDVKKMTDEQRENFGQFVITKLFDLAPHTHPEHTTLQEIKDKLCTYFKGIFHKQK